MVRIQWDFPPSKPINITSESESDDEELTIINHAQTRVAKHFRAQQRSSIQRRIPVVSIDEETDEDEPDDAVIDLTGESAPRHHQDASDINIHNIPHISHRVGDIYLSEHSIHNGDVVRAGDVVELSSLISKFNVSHLVVHTIVSPPIGPNLFVGVPLGRAREIEHWLPRKPNETCLVFEANDKDDRPIEQQALIEVKASQALCRKSVIYTNAIYPQHRKTISRRGALACRWICLLRYANHTKYCEGKPRESVVQHIREPQVLSPDFTVSSAQQRQDWRGVTVRGGSYIPPTTRDGIEVITLDAPLDESSTEVGTTEHIDAKHGQQYTLGDMFCGAGGTSCGAKQAGFKINLGCDADAMACATWRKNYSDARLWETTVTDVINCTETLRVDVLHLSPPCQFFSPAHTRPGTNDEANTAALLGCGDLVNKIRPRIFTLEQTFGITHEAHKGYMDSLIGTFTNYGYSVRWQVVQLLQWGTAVQRKRLIMIGACPGEQLPPFPSPTHAECPRPNSGLRPYTTVAEALGNPPRSSRSDPHHRLMLRRGYMPWNANKPLPRTITTSGCDPKYKGHFDGQRDFTAREIAVLQGFPWTYRFSDKGVKKQAGNAFPPPAVKTLYTHIRKWLLEVDRVRPATSGAAAAAAAPQQEGGVIHTDDDAERPTIIISEEHDMEVVVTISDSDSEEDDYVMLDNERVFTTSPSRESTGTLNGKEVNEESWLLEDIDVMMMESGSESAMRGYC